MNEELLNSLNEIVDYFDTAAELSDSMEYNERAQTIREVINLLEAQEPILPDIKNNIPFCGICGTNVKNAFFCPSCGRAIKGD